MRRSLVFTTIVLASCVENAPLDVPATDARSMVLVVQRPSGETIGWALELPGGKALSATEDDRVLALAYRAPLSQLFLEAGAIAWTPDGPTARPLPVPSSAFERVGGAFAAIDPAEVPPLFLPAVDQAECTGWARLGEDLRACKDASEIIGPGRTCTFDRPPIVVAQPEPPAPPSPPSFAPCPVGWIDGDLCRPSARLDCPLGQVQLLGEVACRPLGAACSEQGSPADLYVQPGGSIADALLAARAGDTIALAPGAYAETIAVDRGITLRGACAELVSIAGGVALSGGAKLDDVTVHAATISIAPTETETATIAHVAVVDSPTDGIVVGAGAHAILRDVRVDHAAGDAIRVLGTLDLFGAVLRGTGELSLAAYGPGISVHARDLTIIDDPLAPSRLGAVSITDGARAELTEVAIDRPGCHGIHTDNHAALSLDLAWITEATPDVCPGAVGAGLDLRFSEVTLRRIAAIDSAYLGLYALTSTVVAEDLLIQGTGRQNGGGDAVNTFHANIRGARWAIDGALGEGVHLESTRADLRDLLVRDIDRAPACADSDCYGFAVHVQISELDLTRAELDRAHACAIVAYAGRAGLEDLHIHDIPHDDGGYQQGAALCVVTASVTVRRAELTNLGAFGVAADTLASLTLTDVALTHAEQIGVRVSAAGDYLFARTKIEDTRGAGIAIESRSRGRLQDVAVRGVDGDALRNLTSAVDANAFLFESNTGAGIHVGCDEPMCANISDYPITLSSGLVEGNGQTTIEDALVDLGHSSCRVYYHR